MTPTKPNITDADFERIRSFVRDEVEKQMKAVYAAKSKADATYQRMKREAREGRRSPYEPAKPPKGVY